MLVSLNLEANFRITILTLITDMDIDHFGEILAAT